MKEVVFTYPCSEAYEGKTQVGLILGSIQGSTGYIYHLAYTPPLGLDYSLPLIQLLKLPLEAEGCTFSDWVIEHVVQLSKLLPGGVKIIGVFSLSEDSTEGKSSPHLKILADLVKSVRKVCSESDQILYVNFGPSDTSSRVFNFSNNSQSIVPTRTEEIQLHEIYARVYVELSSSEENLLSDFKAFIDKCEIFFEPDSHRKKAVFYSERNFSYSELLFKGCLDLRAFVIDEDEKLAVQAIKDDALNNLKARITFLEKLSQANADVFLPKRAFVYVKEGIAFGDFIMNDETTNDACQRIKDLASVSPSHIEEYEKYTGSQRTVKSNNIVYMVVIPIITAVVLFYLINLFRS